MLVRRTFSPVDLDRTFQQLVNSFSTPATTVTRRSPAVTATTQQGTVTLTVDLPGVPAEAVSVEVAGRTLTIKAELDGQSWERSVRIGAQYDVDTVAANYADGRLTVTASSAPAPAVRKVAVTVGAPAAVTAESSESAGTTEATTVVSEVTEASEPAEG